LWIVLWRLVFFYSIDSEQIKNIPQSTIIRDRNGTELYRFFQENRTWIEYVDINSYMINAIVAVEDKEFWHHRWIDSNAIVRAFLSNMSDLWWQKQLQGASTITQQLVKNVYLSPEKTYLRKIQEIFMAYSLENHLSNMYENNWYVWNEIQDLVKKDIITAYLNAIFFGNQSYGIESAAYNFFRKSAKDLSLSESTLLASLPQAPSSYNPINDPSMVAGYWRMNDTNVQLNRDILFNSLDTLNIWNYLATKDFIQKPWSCIQDLVQRASFTRNNIIFTYNHGRKDWVLCRMFELGMIDQDEFKKWFLDIFNVKLYRAEIILQAPHFVFWVQKYLLEQEWFRRLWYDEQHFATAGLDIITTLDLERQNIALESMYNFTSFTNRLWASNRAMLHVDPETWDVLVYHGSRDYYNDEIWGQYDVIQAKRQPWSIIKPLLYAFAYSRLPLSINNIIADYPLEDIDVNNHDYTFWWNISLARALVWSRNLPVIRLLNAAGSYNQIVWFLNDLWFNYMDDNYDYPTLLGAHEVSMRSMAQAYIHLAAQSKIPELNPILQISLHQGRFLYKKVITRFNGFIDTYIRDMIWLSLSRKEYLQSERRWLRDHPLAYFALKTGTTDKKIWNKSYPRDARSVLYNPRELILLWAGNNSWKEMKPRAFWWELHHFVLKYYLSKLKDIWKLQDIDRIVTDWFDVNLSYSNSKQKILTQEQQQRLYNRNGKMPDINFDITALEDEIDLYSMNEYQDFETGMTFIVRKSGPVIILE
jgi:membrane peptidoglycan carboxypeptidase